MRKSLLTAMGIMALALAVPSAALAHHGRGHHRHHHHGALAHHAKFRIVHIGAGASGSAPPSTTPPTTPPAPENAGTVASYTGGVLTLTLNDNSTVSGKVTANTRIRCVKATPPTTGPVTPTNEGPGDDNGQGDDQDRGDMNQGDHGWGGWQHGDKGNDGDDDDGVEGTPEPPCDSSSLTPGAIVRAAELRIGPGGTEFESILLVR
jgi:hypothetical protein